MYHKSAADSLTVADPGFPVGGGGGADPLAGRQPQTHTLFGENVCKNEIDPVGGGGGGARRRRPPGSAHA